MKEEKKEIIRCFFCNKEIEDYISNKRIFCSKKCWYEFIKQANNIKRIEIIEKILKKHKNPTQKFLIKKYGQAIVNYINYQFSSINKAKDFFGLEKNLSGGEKKFNSYKIDENLGYIIGVCLGDACVNSNQGNHIVNLIVKDKDFAKEFAKRLSIVLKQKKNIRETIGYNGNKYYIVSEYSKQFVYYLKELLNDFKWIKNTNKKIKISILKGLFDSEGNISKRKRIIFTNTTPKIYKLYEMLCKDLGYHTTKLNCGKTTMDKNIYRIFIHRKYDREKFMNNIGTSIQRKEDRFYEGNTRY